MNPNENVTGPRAGQWLFASCSAEYYGQILAVGEDPNGQSVVDIRIEHPDDIIWCESVDMGQEPRPGEWENPLTYLELPEGVKPILRSVLWRPAGDKYPELIVCNTPGAHCYRCTKLFALHDVKEAWVK